MIKFRPWLKNLLKSQPIFKKLNDLSLLQTPIYHGTSGAWIVTEELNAHIHIANSYSYFENAEGQAVYDLCLRSGEKEHRQVIILDSKASAIIHVKDFFKPEKGGILCGSFRLNLKKSNLNKFVPYAYTSLIGSSSFSTVHSSSFGTSTFKESVAYTPNFIFTPEFTNQCSLILLTLYNYQSTKQNKFEFSFIDPSSNQIFDRLELDFTGDVCHVNLGTYLDQRTKSRNFKLKLFGPAASNPYFLIDNRTLFHF